MKKKYFAPQIEELKMDEPVVLNENVGSGEKVNTCPDQQGCGMGDV